MNNHKKIYFKNLERRKTFLKQERNTRWKILINLLIYHKGIKQMLKEKGN